MSSSSEQNIPNYLVPAILSTICCCLPVGIIAIIFAAQVDSKLAAGDRAGALEASNKAKLFTWMAVILGLLGSVLYAVLMVLAIIAEQGGQ
ncbi:MAG: CD225/dispanin family protein [Cyanobacteria bacterium J003]|nr:MAG: CD225/dispanin family protein [Cyanobacteria bacterium J003]